MNNTSNNENQERDMRMESIKALRDRNNQAIIVKKLIYEEEEPDKEETIDHVNRHNHDYRVKFDIHYST